MICSRTRENIVAAVLVACLLFGPTQGQAQMFINSDGYGEALHFPFYSAANDNDTYIHVVNTTGWIKALRVRFHEAENGAEVLGFNLYLAPHDHWSGAVTLDFDRENGVDKDGAAIITVDTSCTVPELGTPNPPFDGEVWESDGFVIRTQPFTNSNYADDAPNDGIERTLQGYVEIIEMGQLAAGPAPDIFADDLEAYLADDGNDKGHATVHNSRYDRPSRQTVREPNGCEKLVNAWGNPDGAWVNNPGDELLRRWQGAGLYGYATVINVQDGTAAGYDAIAIDNFVDPATATGAVHKPADSAEPNWENGVTRISLFRENGIEEYAMRNGVDAVSGLFMNQAVENEFIASPAIRGVTDWIVSQPTKRFLVGPLPDPPYVDSWDGREACNSGPIFFWDREEVYRESVSFFPASIGQLSGPTLIEFDLCTAVSAISFGAESAIRATNSIRVDFNSYLDGVTTGWAYFDLTGDPGHYLDTSDGHTMFGLPVTGFAVISYRNDDASQLVPGVLAAYASSQQHKRSTYILENQVAQ